MRRQTASTAEVHGDENRRARLDPFELPARVTYRGAARAGTALQVAIIGQDSVMIRRETNAGVPLYVTVPLAAYSGVLLTAKETVHGPSVALTLHHPNGDLDVPLFEADDTDDVIADWQAWSRTLARPLLIRNSDGEIREPRRRLGGLTIKSPTARRANRFFAERRPRFLCERRTGGPAHGAIYVEHEMFARSSND
jgi:Family of unknown function (DUF6101)